MLKNRCHDRVMMMHELEVSIVAAPLEAIDRRVLSQAWYSALHLAVPARQIRNTEMVQRRSAMPSAPYRRALPLQREATQAHLPPQRSARSIGRAAYGEAPILRRLQQCRLAAGIERAFAAASTPRRATFSLGRGHARVHVVLQTTPTRTILIALCPPQLRADVGQALAQARVALAARGIALDLQKLGGRACS